GPQDSSVNVRSFADQHGKETSGPSDGGTHSDPLERWYSQVGLIAAKTSGVEHEVENAGEKNGDALDHTWHVESGPQTATHAERILFIFSVGLIDGAKDRGIRVP